MSPDRRIFLNILATYGRSLYALVLGLFTARWVLQALGQVDFGLYGLVGGLTVVVLATISMKLVRDRIAAVMNVRQTYTVRHIQTLFILSRIG